MDPIAGIDNETYFEWCLVITVVGYQHFIRHRSIRVYSFPENRARGFTCTAIIVPQDMGCAIGITLDHYPMGVPGTDMGEVELIGRRDIICRDTGVNQVAGSARGVLIPHDVASIGGIYG